MPCVEALAGIGLHLCVCGASRGRCGSARAELDPEPPCIARTHASRISSSSSCRTAVGSALGLRGGLALGIGRREHILGNATERARGRVGHPAGLEHERLVLGRVVDGVQAAGGEARGRERGGGAADVGAGTKAAGGGGTRAGRAGSTGTGAGVEVVRAGEGAVRVSLTSWRGAAEPRHRSSP